MKLLKSKLKKYILNYEEIDNKLKVNNIDGEYRIIDNTIQNKLKVMEIIKKHREQIDKKINYYENKKTDYKIIIMSSSLMLIFLGCLFGLSFFFGSYLLMFTTFFAFSILFYLYILSVSDILIFRSEVKKLENILNNKKTKTYEIFDIIKDLYIILRNIFYDNLIRIIDYLDNKKVKNN